MPAARFAQWNAKGDEAPKMTFPIGLYLIVGGGAVSTAVVARLKRSNAPTAQTLLREVIALPAAGSVPPRAHLRVAGRLFALMAGTWLVGIGGLMWSDETRYGSWANTFLIGAGLFFFFGGFFAMWHAFSQLKRSLFARRMGRRGGNAV